MRDDTRGYHDGQMAPDAHDETAPAWAWIALLLLIGLIAWLSAPAAVAVMDAATSCREFTGAEYYACRGAF